MKHQDPLDCSPIIVTQNVTQNKRGRPHSSVTIKFCPQPQSIISLKFIEDKNLKQQFKDQHNTVSQTLSREIKEPIGNPEDTNQDASKILICEKGSYELDSSDLCNETKFASSVNNIQLENKTCLDSLNNKEKCDTTNEISNVHNDDDGDVNMSHNQVNNEEINNEAIRNKSVFLIHPKENDEDTCIYSCDVCTYRCYKSKQLRKHMLRHSNAQYKCEYEGCSYVTKILTNLNKHKRIHTKEKPYVCNQCTFRSNFVSSLKVHKRIHTHERPFCCEHCGYLCNSSSNLKKHCYHRHLAMVGI